MTFHGGIDPEFYSLLNRSEELLAIVKQKREARSVDWQELPSLHNEISTLADKMTEMVSSKLTSVGC